MANYNVGFYDELKVTGASSAAAIVPWVLELVSPASVIDVGCGTGTWTGTFLKHGVKDVLGLDGEWVQLDQLEFPREHFRRTDLRAPFRQDRTFDLAVSLEVAEHLPEASAEGFVASVAALAPAILFSAAIPGQGGFLHVNEQWPTYWARLFAKHGFLPYDCIRGRFWDDPKVAYWYCQNAFLFLRQDALARYPRVAAAAAEFPMANRPAVHPAFFTQKLHAAENPGFLQLLRMLPGAFNRSMQYRLGRQPAPPTGREKL